MSEAVHGAVLGFISGAFCVFLAMGALWSEAQQNYVDTRTAAIEHGAAYYHPQTGELMWRKGRGAS